MALIKIFVNVVTGNQVTTFQEQCAGTGANRVVRPSLRQARFLHLVNPEVTIASLHSDLEKQASVTSSQLMEKNFCLIPGEYSVGDCVSNESEVYLVIPTSAHHKRAEKRVRRRKNRVTDENSENQPDYVPEENSTEVSEPPLKRGKKNSSATTTPLSTPKKGNQRTHNAAKEKSNGNSISFQNASNERSKSASGTTTSSASPKPTAKIATDQSEKLPEIKDKSPSNKETHLSPEDGRDGHTNEGEGQAHPGKEDDEEVGSSSSLHSSDSDTDMEELERSLRRKAVTAPRSASATPTASASASPRPSISTQKESAESYPGQTNTTPDIPKQGSDETTKNTNSVRGLARLQELSIPDVHDSVQSRNNVKLNKEKPPSDVESAESSSSVSGTSESSSSEEEEESATNKRAGSAGKSALRSLLKK